MSREEQDKDAIIAELTAKVERLQSMLDAAIKMLHGSKSEKLDPAQLELLLDPEAAKKPDAADCDQNAPAAESKPKRKRNSKLRKSLEELPVKVTELTPEEVLADPDAFRLIRHADPSDKLAMKPAEFWVERTVRGIYARKDNPYTPPVVAPLPPCLLEGSVLTPSLLAYLITEKFCYHQPLYRQEWRMKIAHDIHITRNIFCHWMSVGADRLEPLYKHMAEKIRESDYVQVDETPIKYLKPKNGKTAQAYFWVYNVPGLGVLYDWKNERANTALDGVLGAGHSPFSGVLQCDGYSAYPTWIRKQKPASVEQAACMAHVRRKFFEAKADHSKITGWVLHQIGLLYGIESRLREQRAGPAMREAVRCAESRPIYRRLETFFTKLQQRRSITPKSKLGEALHYALGQWQYIETYLSNGLVEIDNNLAENAVRPTKLGAKNWLFVGREDTGWRSAVLFTMVENCRRLGRDPHAYLEWVFERLLTATNQDDYGRLMPAAWAAAHPLPSKVA